MNSMEFQTTTFQIGKNRIEALSDGIFAIVMTLLILELRVPNLPPSAPATRPWARESRRNVESVSGTARRRWAAGRPGHQGADPVVTRR